MNVDNLLPKFDFTQELAERKQQLDREITARRKRLMNAPGGNLHIAHKKNTVQYFVGHNGNKNSTYIKKSDTKLIFDLAQKRYDEAFIEAAQRESNAIQRYIKCKADSISDLLSSFPNELKSVIDYADMSDKDYAYLWQNTPYIPKKIGENIPVHITIKGERVRSKSEELIANALFNRKIPYKYECPINIYTGELRYPDFTVLCSKTRNVFYWEHLGKVDDPSYADLNVRKFRDYEKSGIILGKNLLVTYETLKMPLTTSIIEDFIEAHF